MAPPAWVQLLALVCVMFDAAGCCSYMTRTLVIRWQEDWGNRP